ncbi:uncharacterized protein BP5553_01594 [Venustampulla echinocandica]|uniref:Uncharacterized protein n=1 Tax=Venustampulla echinocandica TaxID=2656787 RepID=A0A370U1H7_9HELO|nr:uncharacterized protein BP5553_01594 [Venustampulla echinocandica]RDL41615.1 hypothetical protein BP5553_01594 [Venustampulla echinocandica]
MMRQLSHGSAFSSSASTASPKVKKGFFQGMRKKSSSNTANASGTPNPPQELNANGERTYLHRHSEDPIVASPLSVPEFDSSRSSGFPSPDPYVGATHDPEYLHLKENLRRLRKAPSGSDAKKLDVAWEVYKKVRDENLQLCKSLLQKSQSNARNTSLDSNIDPLDTRSSYSGSVGENPLPFHVNDQWLAAIQEYKAFQEQMLDNFRVSLLATYMKHEPGVSNGQIDIFLDDIVLRKNLISKWRDASIHAMKSEKPLSWEQLKIRSLNFDKLKQDVETMATLFAEPDEPGSTDVREYVVAKKGDTILEFANKGAKLHPVLRFRVSSHLLAESSPLFAQMLLPPQPGSQPSLDMAGQLPPAPTKHVCKDGMEVKVYAMPQIEPNKHEALTILLHAAHMHHNKVPRQIDFRVFVSIAEWLPQWVHMATDDSPDGLLLISFAFGLRRIFTRMSKTAILNALDDDEIQSKDIWPQAVRDKIKAIRAAKLAQIRDCCTNAMGEYFRPPSTFAARRTSVGSLELTAVPRCPKGSHHCDATNLGWLMLVYNELRVLPNLINNIGFQNPPNAPRRSLNELINCLRLMPSAPQVHAGVCDYAPAFRSAIGDISNSITGLTLRDVTGRDGWALSKNAGPNDDTYDEDAIELPAASEYPTDSQSPSIVYEESVSNYSSSVVDAWGDGAEARSERAMSQASRETASRNGSGMNVRAPTRSQISSIVPSEEFDFKFLATDKSELRAATVVSPASPADDASGDDIYYVSPPFTPLGHDDMSMSREEAQKILWPDSASNSNLSPNSDGTNPSDGPQKSPYRRIPNESNEKFLLADVNRAGAKEALHRKNGIGVKHIEDKARMMEDDKHLRDEKDRALGLGIHKPSSPLR